MHHGTNVDESSQWHATARRPALIATAVALQWLTAIGSATAADAASMRCDPAPRWQDYSTITMATTAEAHGGRPAVTMTFEISMHDDGDHLVADGPVNSGPTHVEIIQLNRPQGHLVLASDPSAPLQLGEVQMVFELPLLALRRQFESPCGLRANTRYPVEFGIGDDAVSGDFELLGDSIRIALKETRRQERFTYAGSISYKRTRGAVPASTAIRGWTIFRGGVRPQDGEPSRFDTLADLPDSAFTPTR